MRILAISGSLRRDSHNSALLRAAAALAAPGVEISIYEGLADIPAFNEDWLEPRPTTEERLRAAIAKSDGVLISTPEYNSSMPGFLKNALDWLSRPLETSPLRNKPVVVVGASTGMFGAVWSQAETRKVLKAIGARVIDLEVPVPNAHEQFDELGRLLDEALEAALANCLQALGDSINQRAISSSQAA